MKNTVIVITGASSGIGAALAQAVSKKGAQVVLLARRQPELDRVAGTLEGPSLAVVTDVTKRADVARAFEAALAKFGRVDAWVSNAGRGITRVPSELTDDDLDEMMSVNVKAALYGAQAVLPHFKARGTGHLIHVSSVLGRAPFAIARSAYSASKHFLNALTANLRMELAASHPGLHVSLVSPGVVHTDFGLNALHGGIDSRALPGQTAAEVAEVIVSVLEQPRADVYTAPRAKDLVLAYLGADDMGQAEKRPPFAPR